jgi:hypothetical protein
VQTPHVVYLGPAYGKIGRSHNPSTPVTNGANTARRTTHLIRKSRRVSGFRRIAIVGVLSIGALFAASAPALASVRSPASEANLASAERAWPGAKLVALGTHHGPGDYLIPDGMGNYEHVMVRATTRGAASSASYCYGCYYTARVNAWLDSFPGTPRD